MITRVAGKHSLEPKGFMRAVIPPLSPGLTISYSMVDLSMRLGVDMTQVCIRGVSLYVRLFTARLSSIPRLLREIVLALILYLFVFLCERHGESHSSSNRSVSICASEQGITQPVDHATDFFVSTRPKQPIHVVNVVSPSLWKKLPSS